ncbi:MAG: LamG domain-containing protein, partial [Patescibacteria group bacterium]
MGNSAAFDGTGDYFSTTDDTSLDFAAADNFSVDFWVRHAAIATNPDYAITKADATTGGYKVYMDASGDMCFDIDDDATWTPDDTACTSGIDYDDNNWHHIAAIKTGTTKIELFMDGLLVASDSTLAASGTLANTNGFYVGIDRDGTSNGWDGYIDEVRVLKGRALTPEEIKSAASRRPYAVYTSPVVDAATAITNTATWDT